jgi:hypothetical protein
MSHKQTSPWSAHEKGYVDYLKAERHLFAWCLVVHGGVSWPDAKAQAEQFYRYEAVSEQYRGLVFHDEAWDWAMQKLFGEQYWLARPDLASPSADYRAESRRFQHE